MYGRTSHRVTLDDLIAFAWSAPMRELASKIGLSDVGLKKLLKSHGVSGPPQGHWNRVHAGRPVQKRPRAPARGPGERPYVLVDRRLACVPEAPLPSSSGPFATAKVPEDLEALRAAELKAIGRAPSASKMAAMHPSVRSLLARDDREQAKAASRQWYFAPVLLYASPYEKRRLRIINAIYLAVQKRGHQGQSYVYNYHTEFSVVIGDTGLSMVLDQADRQFGTHNRYSAPPSDTKRSASVPLRLTVGTACWQDGKEDTLESKIAEISAGIIVEGERAYRTELRRLEEQAERERADAERRRQERLQQANAERVAALLESGRLLAEAQHLRELIARVASAVADGRLSLSAEQFADWHGWASTEADRLDPVLSRQVDTHLRPPVID